MKKFKERCVLIPFGDGPRICSGIKFAHAEVKTAIAEITRSFEISVDKKTPDELTVSPFEFMCIPEQKVLLKFKAFRY